MLYTESMEGPSPLAPEAPGQAKIADSVANRMARPRVDLGVCLGTSSVRLTQGGREVVSPSCVAVEETKGDVLALGEKAFQMEGREPQGVAIVRPIQNGVVVDAERARSLLASAIEASQHGVLFGPRVAFAVASDLTPVEIAALQATARAAGVREIFLVDKLLASAAGVGEDVLAPRGRMVLACGAGTTQLGVLSLGAAVESTVIRRGGHSMDEAIIEHVRRRHQVLLDSHTAERVKKELGCALPLEQEKRLEVSGRGTQDGKPITVELTSNEILEVLQPLLNEIAAQARALIARLPCDLLTDAMEDGALLTGGGAHLRRLDDFLEQETRLRFLRPRGFETAAYLGMKRLLNDRVLRQRVLAAKEAAGPVARDRPRNWLVASLLLASSLLVTATFYQQIQQGAVPTLDGLMNTVLQPAYSAAAPAPNWEETERLMLQEKDRRLDDLRGENRRLRKLLGSGKTGVAGGATLARILARDPKGWLSYLRIDLGSADGVKPGQVVSDGQSLVGRVDAVTDYSCRVRLFVDQESVVAGKVRDTAGVVVGGHGREVRMRYLDPDAEVKVGDKVYTSGLDGDYPKGLLIGRVSRIDRLEDANFKTVSIKPTTHFDDLFEVLVLDEVNGS